MRVTREGRLHELDALYEAHGETVLRRPLPSCEHAHGYTRVRSSRAEASCTLFIAGSSSVVRMVPLAPLAFSIVSNIMDEKFALVADTGLDAISECVSCLVTFGCNPHHADIARRSIAYLTAYLGLVYGASSR